MDVPNEEDGTIWSKGSSKLINTSDEDAWDDTALVKAYDKAIAQLKEESNLVSSNSPSQSSGSKKIKKKNKKSKNANKKWKIGGQCLAKFEEDGLYYEASILSVNSGSAQVKFSYYGNEENITFNRLLPIHKKNEMQVAWNGNNDIELKSLKCEESNDDDDDENESEYHIVGGWHISDICYVLNNKKGTYQQAVINSFTSSDLCHVTIIKSNQKREVKISQLHATLPNQNVQTPHYKSTSLHNDHSHDFPWLLPDLPMHVPPPPPFINLPGLQSNSFLNNNSYPYKNIYNGDNSFSNTKLPQCPPVGVIPEDVVSGKEEALANMLMSWYMSGYHTGYYQGIHHDNQNSYGRKKNRRRQWDKKHEYK